MAFNTVPTVAALDAWTSSQHNTYIKDNFAALWPYTTAGDTTYAASSSTLARLGIGLANTFYTSDGSVPSWAGLIFARQGGSSSVFTSPGTTTYTNTRSKLQMGYGSVTVSAGAGTLNVTYPSAYSATRPAIFLSCDISTSETYTWSLGHSNDTLTGFRIELKFAGSVAGSYSVGWLAIGGS